MGNAPSSYSSCPEDNGKDKKNEGPSSSSTSSHLNVVRPRNPQAAGVGGVPIPTGSGNGRRRHPEENNSSSTESFVFLDDFNGNEKKSSWRFSSDEEDEGDDPGFRRPPRRVLAPLPPLPPMDLPSMDDLENQDGKWEESEEEEHYNEALEEPSVEGPRIMNPAVMEERSLHLPKLSQLPLPPPPPPFPLIPLLYAPRIPPLLSNKEKGPKVYIGRRGVTQPRKDEILEEIEKAMLKLDSISLEEDSTYDSFQKMNLRPELLRGIHAYGLEKPSAIQQTAIVPCIKGRDAIIQAQSGMGKTATLVITILQNLDMKNPNCQALIIVPTRELAEQMEKVIQRLSHFMGSHLGPVTIGTCVGGTNLRACIFSIFRGKQIIVGTIGRTTHMITGDERFCPALITKHLKVLALDEADQLLSFSERKQLDTILKRIPQSTQMILMSATMPGNTLSLAWKITKKPEAFLLRDFQLTLQGIRQYYVSVEKETDKTATLVDLYPLIKMGRGMIFCNSKITLKNLVMELKNSGIEDIAYMTAGTPPSMRNKIMQKFRSGESGYRMLVTSDLLGRGIDVQQVNLVVNYDLPERKETYIHRVGRAGRYGRKGVALTFVTGNQENAFKDMQEFYSTTIEQLPRGKDNLLQLLE